MSDKESGREKVAWKYIKQTDDDDDRRWAAAGASYDVSSWVRLLAPGLL